ncbi:hypothetical protein [Ralstonia solanacearum]|uniref:hypothetical protein n=1 Tax=Ralstonia pseudosolanacearum TaxID=1310165 RepID=UPI000B3B717C|nr:ATP-dependent Clp protease ATP-binding protein [Ralstonia solanacearum]
MDYPKSVPGVGLVDGKFVDEDVALGRPGSLIPAEWGNAITDEINEVSRSVGIEPDEHKLDQLATAIRIICDRAIGELPPMQPVLGFTPVQQGTGVDQLKNTVKIGWSGKKLKATVDQTDQGNFVFEDQLKDYLPIKGRAYSAERLLLGGRDCVFNWSGQGGQPNWLWGGNDPANMYVYNPASFRVDYANGAGNVNGVTNPAWAGAQCQRAGATQSFGTVAGNPVLPHPWVVVGLTGPGNGTANAITVYGDWMRNQ